MYQTESTSVKSNKSTIQEVFLVYLFIYLFQVYIQCIMYTIYIYNRKNKTHPAMNLHVQSTGYVQEKL